DERISSIKRIVDKTMEIKKPTSLAILQTVASSKNKMARMESIHALVSFCTPDSEQVLFSMVKDPEPLVRLELAKQMKNMRPDFASMIMNEMLHDDSYVVQSTIRKIAEDLWPDELWDLKGS
ncbi:HEAT repeat domain-containing protein, partial [bacterium]|nr:HEAT repeat domain-containing protein [bacterium]